MICPIHITEAAKNALTQFVQEQNLSDNLYLRIAVQNTNCTNVEFIVGFDTKTEADDEFKLESLNIIIHRSHYLFLLDVELDINLLESNSNFVFRKQTH